MLADESQSLFSSAMSMRALRRCQLDDAQPAQVDHNVLAHAVADLHLRHTQVEELERGHRRVVPSILPAVIVEAQ